MPLLMLLARLEKEVKGNSKDIGNIFTVLKEWIEKNAKLSTRNKFGFNHYG